MCTSSFWWSCCWTIACSIALTQLQDLQTFSQARHRSVLGVNFEFPVFCLQKCLYLLRFAFQKRIRSDQMAKPIIEANCMIQSAYTRLTVTLEAHSSDWASSLRSTSCLSLKDHLSKLNSKSIHILSVPMDYPSRSQLLLESFLKFLYFAIGLRSWHH